MAQTLNLQECGAFFQASDDLALADVGDAERVLQYVLHHRTEERAYFVALANAALGVYDDSRSSWLAAEAIERERLRQELRELAYCLWVEECHRMGGCVHGNDLYHWFTAEKQLADHLMSRFKRDEMPAKSEDGSPNFSDTDFRCAYFQSSVQDGDRTASEDLTLSGRSGIENEKAVQMTPRKADRTGSKTEDGSPSAEETSCTGKAYECETVDLESPEFENKVVVTDEAQTEVLAVADSMEEIAEIVSTPKFLSGLHSKFGSHAEFVILSGRSTRYGAFR